MTTRIDNRWVTLYANGYGVSLIDLGDGNLEAAILKRKPGCLNNVTRRYEDWRIFKNPPITYFSNDDIARFNFLEMNIIESIKQHVKCWCGCQPCKDHPTYWGPDGETYKTPAPTMNGYHHPDCLLELDDEQG